MTDSSNSHVTTARHGRTSHPRTCLSGAWSASSKRRHYDAGTAYAAIDRHKLDDFNPLIYKTHDFGKTWTRISDGIPAGRLRTLCARRPQGKGLLYAGTETGVYFSIDDGAHWQSLQLNLPTTPIHDLAIKDSDLVAATHGRVILDSRRRESAASGQLRHRCR